MSEIATTFIAGFEAIADRVHANAVDKGFWENPYADEIEAMQTCFNTEDEIVRAITAALIGAGSRNKGEMMMLEVSEIAERLEAVRKNPDAPDEHCPEFTTEEIELADMFIRGMDYGKGHGLRLAEAILAKMEFNAGRPRKHNKNF